MIKGIYQLITHPVQILQWDGTDESFAAITDFVKPAFIPVIEMDCENCHKEDTCETPCKALRFLDAKWARKTDGEWHGAHHLFHYGNLAFEALYPGDFVIAYHDGKVDGLPKERFNQFEPYPKKESKPAPVHCILYETTDTTVPDHQKSYIEVCATSYAATKTMYKVFELIRTRVTQQYGPLTQYSEPSALKSGNAATYGYCFTDDHAIISCPSGWHEWKIKERDVFTCTK